MKESRRGQRLTHGFGVNDADYMTTRSERINGKWVIVWVCPFYRKWADMIKRCYSNKHLKDQPTYHDCNVCDEWKSFMAFREWMVSQEWEGMQLDKDFLTRGNKVYSPDTCVFIHNKVNSFINDCGARRGDCLIGVTWDEFNSKYMARCSNPITNKKENLGRFNTEIEAHLAWKKRKHKIACELADSEYVTDERVRVALRNWYK